jgi:YegS/Rv2252/BmrU family lipid kinase
VKTLYVVNARSGGRRTRTISARIRAVPAGAACELVACEEKAHLDAIIASAVAEGFDAVCAVGGDGTVHEIARRLIGTSLALAIIPAGSGNGFARHLGIPLDLAGALHTSSTGRITTIDTASVNGMPFVGLMGIGFDATVAARFAASEVRGLRTYVREGLFAFKAFVHQEYAITIDGETTREPAFVITVANSSQYGNNARIAPLASLQDGLLDIVTIANASLLAAPMLLVRLFAGNLQQSRGVKMRQASRVVIERATEGEAHLDGEPVVLPARLDVQIVPMSLRVIVPEGVRAI